MNKCKCKSKNPIITHVHEKTLDWTTRHHCAAASITTKKEPGGWSIGKCVQMYRAPFLYLPGAPNSLNPPLFLIRGDIRLLKVIYGAFYFFIWHFYSFIKSMNIYIYIYQCVMGLLYFCFFSCCRCFLFYRLPEHTWHCIIKDCCRQIIIHYQIRIYTCYQCGPVFRVAARPL